MTEYPAQKGTWTLIAPDGTRFTGESPIKCCLSEAEKQSAIRSPYGTNYEVYIRTGR